MIKSLIQFNFSLIWFFMFLWIFVIFNNFMHPVSLMFIMIFYNLMICLILSIWKINFIFSILMFIIMISGLLIIFMYFASLISNEQMKTKLNLKLTFFFLINLTFMASNLFNMNQFIFNKFNYKMLESYPINFINLNKFINILYMYSYPFSNLTILGILFLLLTFISIIKINSSSHSFSMRKINF